MSHQSKHLYEFGPFRMDAAERLLLRDGESVPLTPKAFDLLSMLVEHHGHLLEKDELMKAVWPDSFVEEANLSYNVSLIRKALGEGENGQRYIETVPKRGYRFVASVQEARAEGVRVTEPASVADGGEREATHAASKAESLIRWITRRKKDVALVALVGALGGVGFGLYRFLGQPQSPGGSHEPELRIVPVTSFPGSERQPAFSPDGNQVAFVWDGEREDNPDIYVKLVDVGAPLRLTTNPASDVNPVWSPDGRHITFVRAGAEGSGIYLVPALGGPERKVGEAWPQRPLNSLSLSFSPDGKSLAVADKAAAAEPFSIFLLSVETGERRRLTSPPAGSEGDNSPAFSPDGKSLAFARSVSGGAGASDLYVMPAGGGELKRLTFDQVHTHGLTWTANGREIVFSSIRGGYLEGLWRIPANGGIPEKVTDAGGNHVNEPALARQGGRLAYTRVLRDTNIWRLELPDSKGRGAAPARLIYSTFPDDNPQYSPDGARIVFGSNRSGSEEIWVCESDGSNLLQLTNLVHASTGSPSWSPDGRHIAFDSLAEGNRDIYVVSASGGRPRRLTAEASEDIVPSWSRDGQWVYFSSDRSGSLQVWRMPAEGGAAAQVTKQGGFEGFESFDGKFLYYAKGRDVPGIWRIPVGGGEETPVLDHRRAGLWRSWAVAEQGIYFVTAETPGRPLLEYFSFASGRVTQIAKLERPIRQNVRGISLSPDGRWILYTQMDQSGSDIMLMENFR
jgi:Tol biopolymer transport system component/DNA-binding winged helix-turn-helix (wHTH) protein